jgi:hypothetical protein
VNGLLRAPEASKYLKISANQGFVSGQANCGICCLEGLGAGIRSFQAAKHSKTAVDEGDSYGKLYSGIHSPDSKGVSKDTPGSLSVFGGPRIRRIRQRRSISVSVFKDVSV